MSSLSLDSSAVLPARPGYATEGQPITVYANYVQLVPRSDLTLYSYDVSEIKPEVVGKKRTQIIRLLMNESPELASYRGDMGEDDLKERAPQYKIAVKYTKTLAVGDLMSFLTATNPSVQYDSKLEMIQGLNIFLKHWAKSNNNVATIGASKTFSMSGNANKLDLGRGPTALRGFFTSVRAATNRILVNVNRMASLRKFLRRARVRTAHLKEKKKKKGEVIHRPKTIWSLAKKTRCAAYKDGKTSDLSRILTIYLGFSSSTVDEDKCLPWHCIQGIVSASVELRAPPPAGAGGKRVDDYPREDSLR
ncbi:hypothetical protein F5883DRAFT_653526 [Diaporthe sp. PMI_573]|nr:hypothetical protein F5883DRAFT_653526 [Diaporthaceae sp. PMI_573]